MSFGNPVKVQLKKATIRQLSSRVFQIVVNDEHEACQLAKTIDPDLSPCLRPDERAHEHEQSDVIVSRNVSANQRKPPENKLPPPKTLSRISAKQPPDVLLQAGGRDPRLEHHHAFTSSSTNQNPEQDLPTVPSSPSKPTPDANATPKNRRNTDPTQAGPDFASPTKDMRGMVPGQDVSKPTPGTYSNMAATADALHLLQAVSDTPALGHTFTDSNQGTYRLTYAHKYTLSPLCCTHTHALFI
jgi:hypothetical protein